MELHEFLLLAESTIAANPLAKVNSPDDKIMLTIPEPERHNGHSVRLFGRRGPIAVIVNGMRGRLTVFVSARLLKRYLDRMQRS